MNHRISLAIGLLMLIISVGGGIALAQNEGLKSNKWEAILNSGLTFGAQGDPHNYGRLPKRYMKSVLDDLPSVKADFFVIAGDIDATRLYGYIVMDTDKISKVPIFDTYGDHDEFKEWGFIWAKGLVPSRSPIGWVWDPFNFMRADEDIWQGWTSLPYFWSLNYQGIHFIFAASGKYQVAPSWFLDWVKKDLQENKDKTTVIFMHRGIFEKSPEMTRFRDIVKKSPQVKLIVYAHYHYPRPMITVGDAQALDVELTPDKHRKLTYKGRWYALFSITPDAIRIWARYLDTGKMTLVSERKLSTTFQKGAPVTVSLPYLMSEKNAYYLPVLKLKKAKLRLWGVEKEEIAPDPFFEKKKIAWQPIGDVSLKVVKANIKDLNLPRMLNIDIKEANGSPEAPAKLARIEINNIKFPTRKDDRKTGVYDLLFFVKSPTAPIGRNIWLIIDTVKPNGEIEDSYINKIQIERKGYLHYCLQQTVGNPYFKNLLWRWNPGPRGKEDVFEVSRVKFPREATKFEIYLATPDKITDENWKISLFLFTTDDFYTLIPFGRSHTRNLVVRVGDKIFKAADLKEGQFKQWKLGDVMGGTRFEVTHIEGSRLALVDFQGEIDGFQLHQIRKVKEISPGKYLLGGLCKGVPSDLTPVGVTAITLFHPGRVDGKEVAIKRNNYCVVRKSTLIDISGK